VYGDTAATGAALLAFQEEGFQAGTDVVIDGTNYGDVVGKGLNFILGKATVYSISNEPAGNPDGDGNGVGLKFVTGGNNNRDTYVTGLVMPALAKTGNPNALITTGPLVGRTDGSGAGGAWTMKDVVQNTVDYFAYGQADSGWAQGGWRYYADYGQADNSTAQWPPLAMLYATEMGVTAPDFVKEQNRIWLDASQNLGANPGYGGAYYDNRRSGSGQGGLGGSNEARTGGWLVQANFAGLGGDLSQSDVDAAVAYLNKYWKTTANATWDGNFGHPYAMWGIYKGLELTVGLDDTTAITNLRAQGTAVIDPGDTWNWWEDYCEYLVGTQDMTGSDAGRWGGYGYWTNPLATAWNINILAATEIPGPPIPEPITLVLFGSGIAGLGVYRHRRKARRA
jgi:hypothetical protein